MYLYIYPQTIIVLTGAATSQSYYIISAGTIKPTTVDHEKKSIALETGYAILHHNKKRHLKWNISIFSLAAWSKTN